MRQWAGARTPAAHQPSWARGPALQAAAAPSPRALGRRKWAGRKSPQLQNKMHSKSGKIGLQSPEKGPADGKRDTQARQERLLWEHDALDVAAVTQRTQEDHAGAPSEPRRAGHPDCLHRPPAFKPSSQAGAVTSPRPPQADKDTEEQANEDSAFPGAPDTGCSQEVPDLTSQGRRPQRSEALFP